MDLVVTTSNRADDALCARAAEAAERWRLPYVERAGRAMAAITPDGAAALVFTVTQGIQLVFGDDVLRYHLGTAFIRLGALDRGEGDPLVRAADLQRGDHVLDTTLGLARDAQVAARAVGPDGSVHGVEASLPIHAIVSEGLRIDPPGTGSARITTEHADSRAVLAGLATDSFDVVLLDPMFTTPKHAEQGFDKLRAFADPTPLTLQWVEQARRVARRSVVVKAARPEPWFEAAGLEASYSAGPARWFCAPGSSDL